MKAFVIGMQLALVLTWAGMAQQVDQRIWRQVWADEFNGVRINSDSWKMCERRTSDWNNTVSHDGRLYKVGGGYLRLMGVENKGTEDKAPYLTAAIESKGKFEFKHGKVVIRARFKSAQGAWPALWMLGTEKGWPACGEIDLMEHLNFDNIVYQTVHSEYTLKVDKSNTPPKGTTAPIKRDDWNLYGCEWDADKIVFTVNEKPTLTYPRVAAKGVQQWPFDQKFYFILSMQIGGNWVNQQGATNPGDYPAWMDVDYVRVYQRRQP